VGVEGASTHGLCPEHIVTDAHLRLVTAWAEPARLSDNDSVLLIHWEGTQVGPQLIKYHEKSESRHHDNVGLPAVIQAAAW